MSSASYAGSTLAGGELFSIFGSHLSPSTQTFSLSDTQILPGLGSTRVFVYGQLCPVIAVSPGQINAIAPQLALSPGQVIAVQVEVDGVLSAPVTIAVAAASPGFFTADASGTGQGAIVNQDGTINSASNPAPRGSIVSLYGTGGGTVSSGGLDGYLAVNPPYGTLTGEVKATIAGVAADVLYAGVAPFLVNGVIQLNIKVPQSVPPGNARIAVSVAGVPANIVAVAVQ